MTCESPFSIGLEYYALNITYPYSNANRSTQLFQLINLVALYMLKIIQRSSMKTHQYLIKPKFSFEVITKRIQIKF